jgi:hypothetical protein
MTKIADDRGKVFVSYSSADSEIVHAVCAELTALGLPIWIDHNEIQPGEDIVERLNRGLIESKIFLAFVGSTYFREGRYTSSEFGAAFHKATGAPNWRVMVVRLQQDVELPPLVAGRIYIEFRSVSETAYQIMKTISKIEAWDGPVYRSPKAETVSQAAPSEFNFDDIGDHDLELVVQRLLDVIPQLLRTRDEILIVDVALPRNRRVKLSLLRGVADNESIRLTLRDLIDRIHVQRRFVAGFSRQIDEGLLGKFEVATELALERAEKRLSEARAELRRELGEIADNAIVEQAVASTARQTP